MASSLDESSSEFNNSSNIKSCNDIGKPVFEVWFGLVGLSGLIGLTGLSGLAILVGLN
jgi:hypothetical protein